MSSGRLVLVGGLSFVGKDTACRVLEKQDFWRKLVTVTTRPMRSGEQEGVDYYFRTPAQFTQDDANGCLCEKTTYIGSGVQYGIYRRDVDAAIDSGGLWYCIVDANAAGQLRPIYPGSIVSVHLIADKETLRWRGMSRGEDAAAIERRLLNYDAEVESGKSFDVQLDVSSLSRDEMARVLQMYAVGLTPGDEHHRVVVTP